MTNPNPVDVYIESEMPADNGYGRNGYSGPSSDLPGKKTTSGFLPACELPAATDDWQTRKVNANPYPTTHGMHPAKKDGAIPTTLRGASARPVTKPAPKGVKVSK